MEHVNSLPYSQKPSNGPYPKPEKSNPEPHPFSFNVHFNIILPSTNKQIIKHPMHTNSNTPF
jgi:hypothetical protein